MRCCGVKYDRWRHARRAVSPAFKASGQVQRKVTFDDISDHQTTSVSPLSQVTILIDGSELSRGEVEIGFRTLCLLPTLPIKCAVSITPCIVAQTLCLSYVICPSAYAYGCAGLRRRDLSLLMSEGPGTATGRSE